MDTEKMKAKIRKLLALSNNPNPHEAEAAMAKAKELALEYNIELKKLADAGDEEAQAAFAVDILEFVYWSVEKPLIRQARVEAATALINSFGLHCVFSKNNGIAVSNYVFFGSQMDLEIVEAVWEWLPETYIVEWEEAQARATTNYDLMVLRAERGLAFFQGFTTGLVTANKKIEKAKEEYAIVIADQSKRAKEAARSIFDNLKVMSKKVSNNSKSYEARQAGAQQGSKYKFTKAIA